ELAPRRPRARRRRGRLGLGRPIAAHGDRRSGGGPLWPYYSLTFRFDPEDLLARYVDVAGPRPMSAIHRELALQIKSDWQQNGRIVRDLREALQLGLILLLCEIVAWLVSIAGASGT